MFDALGAKTYVIGNEPDGTNINRGCGSTHIENLKAFVVEKGLDVGFAYDGDADRCLAVDENGNEIDGDTIMFICSSYLKERGELEHDTLVATVMSNLGLFKALEKKDIKIIQTAVGDKYVTEEMMAHGYSLGGENSGHIIFSKHAVTGDGILTSLKLMEVMLESKKTLSELNTMKKYPQLLKNIRVKDKVTAREDADVKAAVNAAAAALEGDGRILVRESGTEPLVRVMVEASTDELCQKYVDSVIDVIIAKGHAAE